MPGPLHKFRVLDLSRQLPGPFCSAILADLGADVLVLAPPKDPFGLGIPHLARNKRHMTLNLKDERGKSVFMRLARDVDVVLEGYRPGVAARLGIDYETLRKANSGIVYCAISGFGQDGPYRDRVGHDINYVGFAGILDTMGEAGGGPVIPGVQMADIAAGSLMAAVGILSALVARERSGRGQMVDISMLDGAFTLNIYHHLLWALSGERPERGNTMLTGHYPWYAIYETKDGRHVTVGAVEPHFWATLCRHFDREDFIADQYAEGPRRDEMFRFFRDRFREKTMSEWVAELADEDICFGPVNAVEEALSDPQLRHRGMVVEVGDHTGRMALPGSPLHFSETPASIRTPPPTFGANTDAVLSALGYSADEVARLRTDEVI